MYLKGLWGYLPANILQGLVGFGSLMVFTRILSPEDYGRYALALGVCGLCYTLFFTWLEAAMARFYPAEKLIDAQAPELYGTIYRLFLACMAAFIILGALALWLWPQNDSNMGLLKIAVAMGLGSAIFRSLVKLIQEQRRSQGRVKSASIIDMMQTAGGFILGVVFASLGFGGGSILLGIGVTALFTLPFFAREDWGRAIKGRFNRDKAIAYAQYGLPIASSLILTLGLYTIDRFLVAHYMSEADAGAYHAGYSLSSRILDVLFIWFGAAGGPAMVNALENGGKDALLQQARQQILTMAFVLFPAIGGLIMVAPALGEILIGEALRQKALSITALISISAALSGLNSYYFLQAFTLAKKTRLLIIAMAIPALANIGLNMVLIPIYGLWGSALACLISFAIGIAASIVLGRNTLALPLPFVELSKTIGCVIIMMGVIALIPLTSHTLITAILTLAVKGVIGILVYGLLAWIINLNDIRHLISHLGLRIYQQLWYRMRK